MRRPNLQNMKFTTEVIDFYDKTGLFLKQQQQQQ